MMQARRQRPSAGFYLRLHTRSTADHDLPTGGSKKKKRRLQLSDSEHLPGGVFKVERLVTRKVSKSGIKYLVLWDGYRKEEATWVSEEDITSTAIECYNNPHPETRVVLDHVSDFISCIGKSLKCGTIRASKFCIDFRLDVFRYLFNSKGKDKGSGKLYEKDDFNSDYFGEDWWFVVDKNGDGCCIDFPVELRPAVKFSPKVYSKSSDGTTVEKLRSYSEIVHVTLLKRRC